MNKTIATILGGATLIGGTYSFTLGEISSLQAEADKLQQEKHLILKNNVWLQARLNQIPVWNTDTVSAEEMTAAYVEKANEEGATTNPNLFEGLRDETIKQGLDCK